MSNEVYGTAKLDVSIETKSNDEKSALVEAANKTDPMMVAQVKLEITHHDGKITVLDVHNFKFEMLEFFKDY